MSPKINHHAQPNEMVIGGDLYEVVKSLDEYRFNEITGCDIGIKFQYPVYEVYHR